MNSSHSQDGPSRHHSTPQPQPQSQQPQAQSQSQSQPADAQPAPSHTPPATAGDRPSDQDPIPTNNSHDTTATTNQVPSPSRNLPPSSDSPAQPVQPSVPHDDTTPLPSSTGNEDGPVEAVQDWLDKTQHPSSQSNQPGSAEDVPLSAADAAALIASAQAGLPIDIASHDIAMLQDPIPPDFIHGLPADFNLSTAAHFAVPQEEMSLPWSIAPGQYSSQPDASAKLSLNLPAHLADADDAVSLDEPVLDETGFDRMARLEFADTFVALTTNTTIIGRDQRVYKRAQLNKKRAEEGFSLSGEPVKRFAYSRSYVSQEGGALGPESDGEGKSRSSKRRKTAHSGRYALSPRQEAAAADDPSAQDNVISSRQYIDHTPGAIPVDIDALRPSSDIVARVDIHGAGPDIIETSKGISRDHLKIEYDEDRRVWKATAIGRNGFFCEEVLYHKDETVFLRSGDHLQIQAVGFIFTISGVDEGKYGNESPMTYSEGGKSMSFDFQNPGAREDMRDTSEGSLSDGEIPSAKAMLDTDDEDDEDDEPDESASPKPTVNDGVDKTEPEGPIRQTIESDSVKNPTASVEPDVSQTVAPPKKRGPGRPPKNGVMSKREERELKKKREEEDKKNNPPQEPGEPPVKRKVGRPRKHPRPEDEGDQPEKRKYKPRKPKNEDGEDEEDPEGDKADKQKRLQKPKTPPLDLGKKEDWPEDKLQKPNKNYQMLIDEVLCAAPDGLTLKQIYKRIATLYPYFCFCVDTKGWESSVRHNLIGSLCFQKNNETHLWKRVPGIPLESGKKRKPSDTASEQRPPQVFAPNFNHGQGYQQPVQAPNYTNQHMGPAGVTPQMNGMQRYHPGGQAQPAAYQNPALPGNTPSQQAGIRQNFPHPPPQQQPQQQQPPPPLSTTVPQPGTHTATTAQSRPPYPSHQQHPYNTTAPSARPTNLSQGHSATVGSLAVQTHAQQPLMARPGQGAPLITQRGGGPAAVHTGPVQQNQRAPSQPHPQQPLSKSIPPAALGPVVEPSLREFIRKFSSEVVKQLQGRVSRPHAVAVSVINRGLGLTDTSLTPEYENFEKAIINIFHTHKLTYSKPKAIAASTATPAPLRPPSATATPTVNGNSAAGAAGSAPATTPSLTHALPNSAPNGPATCASQVNGSLAATASTSNGTTGGTDTGSGRADSSIPRPASAGPTAATSTNPGTASHTSTAVGIGNTSGSSTGVHSAGVPAINSPAPARSSPTPAPGTPVPASTDVQLLDPSLIDVIQQYKRLSQQVLIPKVGQLQAEILVMSAVNRVLEFTDDTIIPRTAVSTKLGLKEAEDALINSLRPRIDTYLRNKQATTATPATSTPTPVSAPTTTPLPLPAPSR
ncbi:hypothetical protein J7T55_014665 [Diaporthe amygdali]|uniref:uncharacterized protein n=1 Tax=Phomopsis amygdali TaxID=1214568 RepID=UPI0022FEE13B|nr:uncharacterized protein J7T55_014665 [Diaporthe amygdali]KAJ0107135.1 hypothetical protein J7T55_014665 [Diaporthe amygdali]